MTARRPADGAEAKKVRCVRKGVASRRQCSYILIHASLRFRSRSRTRSLSRCRRLAEGLEYLNQNGQACDTGRYS